MCDFFGWDKKDKERREAHQAVKDAMLMRFNALYGTDVFNINNWHKLCVAVDIDPLPQSIKACKAVSLKNFRLITAGNFDLYKPLLRTSSNMLQKIKKVHVNLVDLVDTSGRDVEVFESLDELREYTISNERYFPKKSAHAGGVLEFLLREIFSPSR
jgi:hypothetical protein